MYTTSSIDQVRDLDIVQVIGNYIEIKKSGAGFKAKSPFSDDKTASFMVSKSKQIFKCFSSGLGGDHIKFVMLNSKLNFIEAVELIAKDQNIALEREKVTKEVQQSYNRQSELYRLLESAQVHFTKNLKAQNESHWVNKMLLQRGYTEEIIATWQLGYALNSNAVTDMVKQKGLFGPAKDVGLSKTNDNRSYDPYKDRLIFPIYNHKNRVVSFGGRRQNGDAYTSAKYINGTDSEVYHKKNVLYGLNIAKTQISKEGFAVLVEGYTDVITMHQYGADTTVASCGTALTPAQVKLLHKYCEHVILMRDGDSAGKKAALRDIDICLKEGLQVSLVELPEGDDPDTFASRIKDMGTYVKTNAIDAVRWKAEQIAEGFISDSYLFEKDRIEKTLETDVNATASNYVTDEQLGEKPTAKERKEAKAFNKQQDNIIAELNKEAAESINSLEKIDNYKKTRGVKEVAEMLLNIKNELLLKSYTPSIAKVLGVSPLSLKNLISQLQKNKRENQKKEPTFKDLGLPEGADIKFFLKHKFVAVGNQYWFEKQNGKVEPGSTFVFNPLYHINGKNENKRLCEVMNVHGKRKLMDFDSENFVSFNDLKRQLIRLGAFQFQGITSFNFEALSTQLMTEFDPALELQNLGYNAKGFFAFANGIYYNNKWYDTDKYGMIHLPGSDDISIEDEYNEQTEYYFSPSQSAMNINNQAGDDPYENDRKFVLKQASVSLTDWMEQMETVFGSKGRMGVAFNFASLFRDVFIKEYKYFPLLGGFGEKDSGKSGFGDCLQNFFYHQEKPVDLTQTTPVGFTARMTRITNGVSFCDEYKETVPEVIKFGLMGAWNGNGRTKGTINKNRTTSPNINTAIYYCGQFIPTFNDNALPTRTISLMFPSKTYTNEEKENYNKLIGWTNKGLNSLVLEVIKHREAFVKQLPATYNEVAKELKAAMGGKAYQQRILDNYLAILSSFKILKEYIDFPFSYETFKAQCVKGIVDNSESIQDSNGLTEFWSITQYLFERGMISDPNHLIIERPESIKLLANSTKTKEHANKDRKRYLFIRLKMIHQYYLQECQRRGIESIGETTLRNYFKSRDNYYIGAMKSKRFGSTASSCFVFDYEYMSHEDNSIVFLENLPQLNNTEDEPFTRPASVNGHPQPSEQSAYGEQLEIKK